MPANTRQWSSGYLVVARLLVLRPAYLVVKAQEQFANILPEVNWDHITKTKDLLFELYLRIQILQQNSSNIIHLAMCWV